MSRGPLLSGTVIGVSVALVAFGLSLRLQAGEYLDFGIFYASGRAWLDGAPALYPQQNLNPPHLLPLFGLFALLPLFPAYLSWQALNAAGLIASLMVTSRVVRLPWSAPAVALLAASAGTFSQLYFGQVAWVLMVPMTLAWLAWRQGKNRQSAILLGLVVSVKPFLVPAVLLLGRTAPGLALIAGASAIVPLLAVAALAPDALAEWLGAISAPWHLFRWPHLASLSGALIHRGVPFELAIVVAALPLPGIFWRWRRFDPDTQWALMVAVCVTISPLGWAYYTSWAVPPLFALWPRLTRNLRSWLVVPSLVPVLVVAAIPALHGLYALPVLALLIAAISNRHLARIDDERSVEAATSVSR